MFIITLFDSLLIYLQIDRMKYMHMIALAAATLTACTSQSTPEAARPDPHFFVDCGVTEIEKSRLLALPLNDFDQDMQGGWRAIAYQEGCHSVAGYLIEDYIAAHNIIPDEDNNILFWHVGQMHAYAKDYPRAKLYFTQSYDTELLPGEHGYEWALYAKGTIAFLDKDRPELKRIITTMEQIPVDPDRIQSMKKVMAENSKVKFPKGFETRHLNLMVLDGLLECFEGSYADAYGKKCEVKNSH